jgi:hypothetical protein
LLHLNEQSEHNSPRRMASRPSDPNSNSIAELLDVTKPGCAMVRRCIYAGGGGGGDGGIVDGCGRVAVSAPGGAVLIQVWRPFGRPEDDQNDAYFLRQVMIASGNDTADPPSSGFVR